MIEINSETAKELARSEFWKTMSSRDIALFVLRVKYLCMPFSVFHKAIEEALGRPVWTHEMGLNWEGLLKELLGENPQPTLEDIINLLPKGKRMIVILNKEDNK